MKINISPKEFEKVRLIDAFERYKYFIKRVADFEVLYTLKNDNEDIAIAEVDNHIVASLWSAPDFVYEFINDEWKNYKVVEIELGDFLENLVPYFITSEYLLNIFPVGSMSGFVVTPNEIVRDIKEELEKIE